MELAHSVDGAKILPVTNKGEKIHPLPYLMNMFTHASKVILIMEEPDCHTYIDVAGRIWTKILVM